MTSSHKEFGEQRSDEDESAAHRERVLAGTMDLRNQVPTLIASVIFYVGWLLLPLAGGVRGVQLLLGHGAFSLVEYIFAALLSAGVGIFTTLTLITRRTVLGQIAWMASTVAFGSSLFVVWMRGANPEGAEIGLWSGVIAAFLATVAFSFVALRKSPEQLQAEQQARREAGQLDAVGQVQMGLRQQAQPPVNPVLIDDRRQQAARRHRRSAQDSSASSS